MSKGRGFFLLYFAGFVIYLCVCVDFEITIDKIYLKSGADAFVISSWSFDFSISIASAMAFVSQNTI